MSDPMQARKLYPRNATARSHYRVAGNPVTTRPESGVDNSYPGLEFDQRNLDKRFFPGLEFEFHATAVLRSIDPKLAPDLFEAIKSTDLERGVVLLAVYGRFGEGGDAALRQLALGGGLENWRFIHDLEPAPVAIALGALDGSSDQPSIMEDFAAYVLDGDGSIRIERQGDGSFRFAFAVGQRARYLDEDGVIDPAEYRPGDLTRSLCSPWQYDFALCGCFYWASNKPDVVSRDEDSAQFSYFQRRRDGNELPVEPITSYEFWEGGAAPAISEHKMIGDWERLPAVFGGVERPYIEVEAPKRLRDEDILDRDAVLMALRELATVEHGLMVEYLYAYYSIDQNALTGRAGERLRSAAETVLSVAVDEMRHLRWVNEMLLALGQSNELGRFGEMPDPDRDGRGLKHTFSLKRLTPERLDWFITVEAPSDKIDLDLGDDTIDGMYTRLLLSVSQGIGFSDLEKARLLHRIKLIIEEGYDHYLRFLRVKEVLQDFDPQTYLRLTDDPEPQPISNIAHVFETTADAAYAQVISLLSVLFQRSNVGRIDALITGARELMYNLDEAARSAAINGGAPLFRLPEISGLGIPLPKAVLRGEEAVTPSAFVDRDLTPALERALDPVRHADGGANLAASMLRRLSVARERLKKFE